jgi:hypothetical protein
MASAVWSVRMAYYPAQTRCRLASSKFLHAPMDFSADGASIRGRSRNSFHNQKFSRA